MDKFDRWLKWQTRLLSLRMDDTMTEWDDFDLSYDAKPTETFEMDTSVNESEPYSGVVWEE